MKNYIAIGKLAAVFGVNGEMVLRHNLGKKTGFKGLEVIFIEEFTDSFLPYFIEAAKIKSETEVLVKIEGLNNREEALNLLQKQVWLLEEDFKKYAAKDAPISLLGFHVINQKEDIGEVAEVIEQPMQVLLKLFYKEKEVLIPLNEQTLDKVDKRNRRVHVNLPDGLLEIYQ
jgi:16S rRNA processing protein RimM